MNTDPPSTWLQLPDGTRLPTDDKGYLLVFDRWSPAVADAMAAGDGLVLTPDHWKVLALHRDYFARFDIEPPMRWLVKRCAEVLGEDKGNSRHLYRLFPDGPGTQACRYAGLPRPVSCL